MRGLFDPDSKLFALLTKLTLLMELNLWVLLCCLPLVTVGAALSSMHTVLLKIYRDEEQYVATDFRKAMKENLKNGTILWLLYLLFLVLLTGIYALAVRCIPDGAVYVLFGVLLAAVLGLLYLSWALILQSRYVYTIPQCLKNALLAWLQYPGSTFIYPVSLLLPAALCCSFRTIPLLLLGGITLPHLISTTLYSRVFDRMENVPPRMPKL